MVRHLMSVYQQREEHNATLATKHVCMNGIMMMRHTPHEDESGYSSSFLNLQVLYLRVIFLQMDNKQFRTHYIHTIIEAATN